MAIYDTPNLTSGIDDALIDVSQTVSAFIPMLLVFVWFVVFFGGMSSQRRRTGYSDVPMWAMMSSLSVLVLSMGMTLTTGLITLPVLSVVFSITILCGIWLFLSQSRNEV